MSLIEFKNLPDTSTPVNATNLNNNFNELNNKLASSYCLATTTTSSQTISTNYKIKLNQISEIQGNYTLADDGIRIGSGINHIRISGSMFIDSWAGGTNYLWGQILKNNSAISTSIVSGTAGFISSSIPSAIISVSEGDIIYLRADSPTGGTVRTGRGNTWLLVEKID